MPFRSTAGEARDTVALYQEWRRARLTGRRYVRERVDKSRPDDPMTNTKLLWTIVGITLVIAVLVATVVFQQRGQQAQLRTQVASGGDPPPLGCRGTGLNECCERCRYYATGPTGEVWTWEPEVNNCRLPARCPGGICYNSSFATDNRKKTRIVACESRSPSPSPSPLPCEQTSAPACGGWCPAGQTCSSVTGGGYCDCIAASPSPTPIVPL